MGDIEKRLKSKGTITVNVTLPLLVWEEWNEDCESRFGGTRYLKMLHDHQMANDMKGIVSLMSEDILDLRALVQSQANTETKSESKSKTFGRKE
jgi:hypothetical protein